MRKLFGAIFLLSSLATSVFGQDATGRIIGTVLDQTGAVVPNARVVLTNVATGGTRETITDSEGAYQVLLLPIGSYQVSVEAAGFRKWTTEAENSRSTNR